MLLKFAGSIAKGLGDDTYRVLKKHVVSWWLAQTKRDARFADNPDALDRIAVRLEPELKGQTDTVALPAAVEDPGNAALVQVDPDLPREAFVALAQVDWSTQPGGIYRFDSKTGRWKL